MHTQKWNACYQFKVTLSHIVVFSSGKQISVHLSVLNKVYKYLGLKVIFRYFQSAEWLLWCNCQIIHRKCRLDTGTKFVETFCKHFSFSVMNLPNFAKMFTFYTKHYKPSSKCSQYRFEAFYNETKKFKILTEFGKLDKFA